MYSVVEFPDEEAVEVVLSAWVNPEGTLCRYPDKTGIGGVTKLVKNGAPVQNNWPTFRCRILKSYDGYLNAREAANLAQDTSALESDSTNHPPLKRKKNRKSKKVLEESDSEGEHASPNKLLKSAVVEPLSCPLQITFPTPLGETESEDVHGLHSSLGYQGPSPNLSIGLEESSQLVNTIYTTSVQNLEVEYATKEDFTKFQKVIVRQLVQVQQNQNDMSRSLLLLKTSERREVEDFSTLPPHPAGTVSELKAIEVFLKEKENLKLFASSLSLIGASTTELLITRILERFMTLELGAKFSRTGLGKSKLEFNAYTKLNLAIIESVRGNDDFERTTEDVINKLIARWLRFAPFKKTARK
ncbi:hypothetical protein Fcan01_19261 [Folsomia candida]|uniref:DUF4806 domain-containing protein n=1 Tax=Folsomia candida TaxID=158441 RepID=A0A226DKG4_FOLCA|nr:hypothetical protein Fcan01_19261 [Folsomia candida]